MKIKCNDTIDQQDAEIIMDNLPEVCWQITAGDTGRNFADVCLKNDVVIMGPSDCSS